MIEGEQGQRRHKISGEEQVTEGYGIAAVDQMRLTGFNQARHHRGGGGEDQNGNPQIDSSPGHPASGLSGQIASHVARSITIMSSARSA